MSKFADVFRDVGLEQYAFTPSGALSLDQWPTLQTLINDGTRLVIWMGRSLEHTCFGPSPAGSSSLMTWRGRYASYDEVGNQLLTTSLDYNSDTATTPYILDEFAYCMCTCRALHGLPTSSYYGPLMPC